MLTCDCRRGAGVVLALATQGWRPCCCSALIPAQGEMIEVFGRDVACRRDIGPLRRRLAADRDAAWRELRSRGDAAAARRAIGEPRHRVIPDRPSRPWLEHARDLSDPTPSRAGQDDRFEALGKLGMSRAIFVAHSWSGALGAAHRAGSPEAASPASVMLAPVAYLLAGRRRAIQRAH